MMTIKQRAEAIRRATPDCLEELFEMQNRICDLCSYPIQDLILAHLDHSIPVIKYARDFDMPIEEAIKVCNDISNLRVTHSFCNHSKLGMTRGEWFSQGKDKTVGQPHIYTAEELLQLFQQLSEISKKGGLIGGQKCAENGHMARMLSKVSLEQMKKNGREQGIRNSIVPNRMSDTSRLRSKESRALSGRASQEQKKGIFGLTEEERKANARKGGMAAGQIAKESGQLLKHIQESKDKKIGIFAPGMKAKGAQASNHLQWHIRRGIVSSDCPLCKSQQ